MIILKARTSSPFFSRFHRFFATKRTSLPFLLFSLVLSPLAFPYLCVVTFRRLCARTHDPGVPVVSVGNITAGGTGKTLLVGLLTGYFLDRGKRVAVAGHGVGAEKGVRIASGGSAAGDLAGFGDEGAMLAGRFPRLVIAAGGKKSDLVRRLAARPDRPSVIIIDDGFHVHDVKKSINIVTVDAERPFDNGLPLPAGCLRDLPSSLKRAGVIVVHRSAGTDERTVVSVEERLRRYGAPVFRMSDTAVCFHDAKGAVYGLDLLRGKRILAFAGIGKPMNFFRLLATLEPERVFSVVYPDHFRYRKEDWKELLVLAGENGADIAVSTGKDREKILRVGGEGIPLYFLEITGVISAKDGRDFFDIVNRSIV